MTYGFFFYKEELVLALDTELRNHLITAVMENSAQPTKPWASGRLDAISRLSFLDPAQGSRNKMSLARSDSSSPSAFHVSSMSENRFSDYVAILS